MGRLNIAKLGEKCKGSEKPRPGFQRFAEPTAFFKRLSLFETFRGTFLQNLAKVPQNSGEEAGARTCLLRTGFFCGGGASVWVPKISPQFHSSIVYATFALG